MSKAWKYALTNANNRSLFGGLGVLAALAAICVAYGQWLIGVPLAVLAGIAVVLLIRSSLSEYRVAEKHGQGALLLQWAHAAASDEERASRLAMLESEDWQSIMARESLSYSGPLFNTDGTMMLPGNVGLDIKGQLYGATDLHTASYNPDTHMMVDPGNAYQSPIDTDSMGGSFRND